MQDAELFFFILSSQTKFCKFTYPVTGLLSRLTHVSKECYSNGDRTTSTSRIMAAQAVGVASNYSQAVTLSVDFCRHSDISNIFSDIKYVMKCMNCTTFLFDFVICNHIND